MTGAVLARDYGPGAIQKTGSVADGLRRLGLNTRAVNVLTYGAGLNAAADLFARDWADPDGLRSRLEKTPGCGPKMLADLDAKRAEVLGGYWRKAGAP